MSAGPALAWVAHDDEELVAAARGGDQQAFESLLLRHRHAVTALTGRFFFGRPEAEDMAQEAFVKAYLNLDKLRPGTPFRFWVLRVAANCCIDRLRREKRRPEQPVSQVDADEAGWLDRHLATRSRQRHDALESAREARSLMAKVLPALSPKDRTALYLLDGEGLSVAEVAEVLGWSRSNVKVRAFRARRRLRAALEELMGSAMRRES